MSCENPPQPLTLQCVFKEPVLIFSPLVFRGNLDKAIEMFNKAINLAKSEMEMAHLYSLCDAAYAQTEVARKYGLKPPTL